MELGFGEIMCSTPARMSNLLILFSSNKCHASSNRCLTSSNKKLLVDSFARNYNYNTEEPHLL